MRWILLLGLCVSGLAQTPAELQRRAAEKQRAAAELQRQTTRARYEEPYAAAAAAPPATTFSPPVSAPCDPLDEAAVNPLIQKAATAQELQPELVRAVIERESGFRPCAVSPKGAQGLMQLMPDTATRFGVDDPFDPAQNVATGAKYLKQLLDRFNGDVSLALSAYNAGPAAVEQAGGIPNFAETREYVKAILARTGAKRPAPPNGPMPTPTEN